MSQALVCRRGVTVPSAAGSPAPHRGVSWRSTQEGTVLTKAAVQALHAVGGLPAPEDVLLVNVKPGEWTLALHLPFTSRPPETRRFPFEEQPDRLDEDGWFSATFLFVHGPETLSPAVRFPLVHLVDVTDQNALGHVTNVDFQVEGDDATTIRLGELPGPPPEKVLECVCIPGVTFEFDRSFIRPSVVEHMQRVDAALTAHPGARLFVAGHTDRVGDEVYNKKLSDRRAFSAFCFITNDVHGWEALYLQEQWGLKTVQLILKDLGHDPGPADGLMGPRTQGAMRELLGVPPGTPVQNDQAFRARLFLAYMTGKHDVQATPDQFTTPAFVGCGEYNPVAPPNAAELANSAPGNEPNRRVVVYLLREDLEAPPCVLDDVGPCRAQLAAPGERAAFGCAFYDQLATLCRCELGEDPPPPPGEDPPPPATGRARLRVGVFKEGRQDAPFAGALVALLKLPEQVPSGAWNTGSNGFVSGIELDAGTYSIQVKTPSDSWTDEHRKVQLAPGADETVLVAVHRQGHPITSAGLTVRVTHRTEAGSTPGVGFTVAIGKTSGDLGFNQQAETDSSGAARFDLPAPARYTVTVHPWGHDTAERQFTGSGTSVELEPGMPQEVDLVVTSETAETETVTSTYEGQAAKSDVLIFISTGWQISRPRGLDAPDWVDTSQDMLQFFAGESRAAHDGRVEARMAELGMRTTGPGSNDVRTDLPPVERKRTDLVAGEPGGHPDAHPTPTATYHAFYDSVRTTILVKWVPE